MAKKPTVVHLTPEAMTWLQQMAEENGVSNSVMVEKLIRRQAVTDKREGEREWK